MAMSLASRIQNFLRPHLDSEVQRICTGLDIRPGAITEGGMAGTSGDDRAKLAGHAGVKMTRHVYDRDVLVGANRVAEARAKFTETKGMTALVVVFFVFLAGTASGNPWLERLGKDLEARRISPDVIVQNFVADGLVAFAHCPGAIYNFKKAAEAREMITRRHGEEAMIVADYVAEQRVVEEGAALCKNIRRQVELIGNPFLSFRPEGPP